MKNVETIGEERIFASLHPHPLAFAGQALPWVYVLIVSIVMHFIGN